MKSIVIRNLLPFSAVKMSFTPDYIPMKTRNMTHETTAVYTSRSMTARYHEWDPG
jgi:hypothetical protein